MEPTTWRVVSHLFAECLQLSREDREQLLALTALAQPDLSEEVRALLEAYEQDREFLEPPPQDTLQVAKRRTQSDRVTRPGLDRRISHYVLEQRLGAGGMDI